MTQSAWQLSNFAAQLSLGEVRAALKLDHAERGLGELQIGHEPLPGAILQVRPAEDFPMADPIEAYVRGADLVATYAETPPRTFRPQVYWRAILGDNPPALAAVEVIASSQTSLLDSQPRVTVQTSLPAIELWRLGDLHKAEFKQISLAKTEPQTIYHSHGPGCYLWRLSGDRWSFAEMIPPSDFHATEIDRDDNGLVCLSHRLFERSLEKGVILRARVRGVLLERGRDAATTLEWYRALLESELPLTT